LAKCDEMVTQKMAPDRPAKGMKEGRTPAAKLGAGAGKGELRKNKLLRKDDPEKRSTNQILGNTKSKGEPGVSLYRLTRNTKRTGKEDQN